MIGQKASLSFIFIGILPFRPKKIKLGRSYLVLFGLVLLFTLVFLIAFGEEKGKSGTSSKMGGHGVWESGTELRASRSF